MGFLDYILGIKMSTADYGYFFCFSVFFCCDKGDLSAINVNAKANVR